MSLFHVCFTWSSFCFVGNHFGSKTCICFSILGRIISKNPPIHYLLFFIHQSTSKGLRFTTSISRSLCTDVTLRWFYRTSIVTTLPYWRFCRIDEPAVSTARRLCRIEDFAVFLRRHSLPFFLLRVSKTRVETIIRWNELKQTASVLTNRIQTWSNYSSKRKGIK